jgi:hypothetical protein
MFTGHGKLDVGFANTTFCFAVTVVMLEDCLTLTDVSIFVISNGFPISNLTKLE